MMFLEVTSHCRISCGGAVCVRCRGTRMSASFGKAFRAIPPRSPAPLWNGCKGRSEVMQYIYNKKNHSKSALYLRDMIVRGKLDKMHEFLLPWRMLHRNDRWRSDYFQGPRLRSKQAEATSAAAGSPAAQTILYIVAGITRATR